MKKLMLTVVLMTCESLLAVDPVLNVQARPSNTGDGKVAISFELRSLSEQTEVTVCAVNVAAGKSVSVTTLYDAEGNKVANPHMMKSGLCRLFWDARSDLGSGFYSSAMSVTVKAVVPAVKKDGLYCVIDLSGGPSALWYPVSYLDEAPEDGWSEEYKRTKIVLRKIPAGLRKIKYEDPLQDWREVTINTFSVSSYYIGVMPITKAQLAQIVPYPTKAIEVARYGYHGASFEPTEEEYLAKDCEAAYSSRQVVRGRNEWNDCWIEPDSYSILGRLRAKTGLDFDLPTAAQWIYASESAAKFGCDFVYPGEGARYHAEGEMTADAFPTDYQYDPDNNVFGDYGYWGVSDRGGEFFIIETFGINSNPKSTYDYDNRSEYQKFRLVFPVK